MKSFERIKKIETLGYPAQTPGALAFADGLG
jgi:hypothetical protein